MPASPRSGDRLEGQHVMPIVSTIRPRRDGIRSSVVAEFKAAVTDLARAKICRRSTATRRPQ